MYHKQLKSVGAPVWQRLQDVDDALCDQVEMNAVSADDPAIQSDISVLDSEEEAIDAFFDSYCGDEATGVGAAGAAAVEGLVRASSSNTNLNNVDSVIHLIEQRSIKL